MTPYDVLEVKRFEKRMPKLSAADRDYVLGHCVALQTAGITPDAAREKVLLERLILQFAWRLAYCRYVEHRRNQFAEPYEDWEKAFRRADPEHLK